MNRPQIQYELGECRFGPLLTACTGYGLCAVFFNRPHDELLRDLRRRFERFDCIEGRADLKRVSVTIEDPEVNYPYELDLHGTDFQRRVWLEIRAVTHAHTVTYSWLAEAVGKPKAVRAVAQACGANPVAVIVPCHRIVGKNFVGQYRWGAAVKQQLLDMERSS